MFTAAQTELGKDEEWFWDVSPRVLTTMLKEKKRIDIEKMKIAAYLNAGGSLEETEEIVPGIDEPVNPGAMGFLMSGAVGRSK